MHYFNINKLSAVNQLFLKTLIPTFLFILGADEIADTIVYLLSERASNITGTKIVTDGGMLVNWRYWNNIFRCDFTAFVN